LQILWLNVVTDTFPALALAVEPAEPETMKRPPRDPQEAILSRRLLGWIGSYAALITIGTLAAFLLTLHNGTPERARTAAFMTLAFAQAIHLANARSSTFAVVPRRIGTNRWALGALVLVVALQLLALQVPVLSSVLGLVPLTASDWAIVLPLSLVPFAAGLVLGLARRRVRPNN